MEHAHQHKHMRTDTSTGKCVIGDKNTHTAQHASYRKYTNSISIWTYMYVVYERSEGKKTVTNEQRKEEEEEEVAVAAAVATKESP